MSNSEQPTMMNCAMKLGLVLGGFYIVKFCLQVLCLYSVMASLLFLGSAVLLPFFIFLLVLHYCNQFCGGRLGFSQAYIFSVLTVIFGSLLASVAYYVYFAYIDGGAMVSAMAQSIEQLQSVDFATLEGIDADAITLFGQYIEIMQQAMQHLQAMSSVDMTLYLLNNNVCWGAILSLPIAFVVSLCKLIK